MKKLQKESKKVIKNSYHPIKPKPSNPDKKSGQKEKEIKEGDSWWNIY
ncbi:MAG: hypothetical protein RR697_03825 [Malacoplasma sp.]